LAAYDTGRTRVFGHCAASTGIEPFMALVEQVMTRDPYASATRVFWIVDNGSSHRSQAAIDRLAKALPERRHGSHSTARVLTQPDRDLLLGGPAQGRGSQRLHPP
jgi:ferredoxin-NADP reductase